MTPHSRRTTNARSLLIAAALIGGLAACGSGSDSGDNAADPAAPAGADASSGDSGGSPAGAVSLSTTPITWNELQYPGVVIEDASDGGGSAPALAECPLLSSASFDAGMTSGTPERPPLSEASTTECRWQGGFSTFSVTTENAADVDVDDHSGRGYNLDVEPVVVPQDGPGDKAVLLVDTAFADTGFNEGDGFTYGYFFVLDGQAVTLRSTAVFINDDSWRPMADEVAAAITAGTAGLAAPQVEPAASSDDSAAATPPAPCTYFTVDEVGSLLGVDPSTIAVSVLDVGQTKLCSWEAPSGPLMYVGGGGAQFTFEEYPNFNINAEDISDAVGAPAYLRPGVVATAIGFFEVPTVMSGSETVLTYSVEVTGSGDVIDVTSVLANLMSRVQPPA